MQHTNTHSPVLDTGISILLFIFAAMFGILENVDIILNIVAKIISIAAGIGSLYITYRTLFKSKK